MKILSNPQNLSVQRPNRSTQARAEKAEQPQDKVELNPQYRHEVRQGSITGALIGSAVGTLIGAAAPQASLALSVALGASGALVGACIAEEQVKLRWGVPIEVPAAFR